MAEEDGVGEAGWSLWRDVHPEFERFGYEKVCIMEICSGRIFVLGLGVISNVHYNMVGSVKRERQ